MSSTPPDGLAETLAEVVERINLERARFADEEAEERGEPGRAVELWNTVYGPTRVSGRDLPELRENMTRTFRRKLDAASVLVNKLVWMVATAEGVEPGDVLDRAERELTATFQGLAGGESSEPDIH